MSKAEHRIFCDWHGGKPCSCGLDAQLKTDFISPATRAAIDRNARAQTRYDELMREGKHGHYETMFRVVREEVEAARVAIEKAMQAKQAQLIEYRDSFEGRDDEVGKHSRIVAVGRLLQLEADMALLSLQPQI